MKKTYLLPLLICCWFSTSFAQTKLIAHKSHSGSTKNFKFALDKDWLDIRESNFGIAPEPLIKLARLDSLIHLSDEAVIMVTSSVCTRKFEDTSIWSAGKDTVYNHPLFGQQHELDKIQKVLDKEYHFDNASETVEFIGYDNQQAESALKPKIKQQKKEKTKQNAKLKKQKKAKKKWAPATMSIVDYSSENMPENKSWWIGILALFSILIGWIANKLIL